nr:hypothetical protein [Haematobacter missouriensis]
MQQCRIRDRLVIEWFELGDQLVELFSEIEFARLVIGLCHHDFKDAERFASHIDARENLGGNIDRHVFHEDDREVVGLDAAAVFREFFVIVRRIGRELLKTAVDQVTQPDPCAVSEIGYFRYDDLILFAGFEIDEHIREVVCLARIALDLDAAQRGVKTGQSLLAVEHEGDGLAVFRLRQRCITEITNAAQPILSRPEDERADRIAFDDAVEQGCGLLHGPDEISLELRNLDLPTLDVRQKISVVRMRGTWQNHAVAPPSLIDDAHRFSELSFNK